MYYQGLLVKAFLSTFSYRNYINILSVYPKRGTKLGDTLLTMNVLNGPDQYLPTVPLLCRFSFDFLITPSSTIFYTQAT